MLAGESFVFQPTAHDPDGDRLTYSAANLPQWLTLDSATGAIRGRPSAADIGSYAGITLTVSDGRQSATLGPFSITVVATGEGSARLSWTPPTENLDGSQLTNLAGFVIRYGRSPDELTHSISIDNPSVSTYQVDNLTSGTWYFGVEAFNADGVHSPLSSLASKTIA